MKISGKRETAKRLHVLTAPTVTASAGTGFHKTRKTHKKTLRRNSRREEREASFAPKE
jgi:hypothetical protein